MRDSSLIQWDELIPFSRPPESYANALIFVKEFLRNRYLSLIVLIIKDLFYNKTALAILI